MSWIREAGEGAGPSTFARYMLFQIPGTIMILILLLGLRHYDYLGTLTVCLLLIGWVIKDLALYPLLRSAYVAPSRDTDHGLAGRTGRVQRAIDPRGTVRVRGELWRAVSADGTPIPAGSEVVIEAVDRLTLHVRPASQNRHR